MKKKALKDSILITCISYTAVAVILSVLALISPGFTMELTSITYLQLFGCTTIISCLMYFTSKIQVESQIAANLIQILDIAIVVYGVGGGLFQWFPWEITYIAEVAFILIVVFLFTNYIMIWQNNEITKAINKKIKERKK